MDKIKGTGIEQIDGYDYQKRMYRKSLDLWIEKVEIDLQERNIPKAKGKQWRGLIHIISECMMEAFSAGIEGNEEPAIISKIENCYEELASAPMGAEFSTAIISLIRQAYDDGQKRR